MRAAEFLRFHLRRRPELFFNRATSVGEPGCGWATDEQTLNIRSSLFRMWSRRVEKKSCSHILFYKGLTGLNPTNQGLGVSLKSGKSCLVVLMANQSR
jgi:hypothetical protein